MSYYVVNVGGRKFRGCSAGHVLDVATDLVLASDTRADVEIRRKGELLVGNPYELLFQQTSLRYAESLIDRLFQPHPVLTYLKFGSTIEP